MNDWMNETEMDEWDAAAIETFLQNLLVGDPDAAMQDAIRTAATYDDAGILTRDRGLVLRFENGAEFQITIVRSERARKEIAR